MRLLSLKSVSEMTSLSATSIRDLVRAGRFPRPIKVPGLRRSAWSEAEVTQWIEARLAERAA